MSDHTLNAIRDAWKPADRGAHCGQIPDAAFVNRMVSLFSTIAFPQLATANTIDSDDDGLVARLGQFRAATEELNCWALVQPDRVTGRMQNDQARSLATDIADNLVASIPELIRILQTDLDAAMDGDPASRSREEILICYPGFRAILVHRLAHRLYSLRSWMAARLLAEWVHGETGIDIHPGATIGHHFFVDHGTGVVIGETCRVGNRVRIYQGVTLGALNFPRLPSGELVRDTRRHPTIGDDVVIYANASILGGETVIGDRCLIGSSVWLTESVPSDTRVAMEKPRLRMRGKQDTFANNPLDYQI